MRFLKSLFGEPLSHFFRQNRGRFLIGLWGFLLAANVAHAQQPELRALQAVHLWEKGQYALALHTLAMAFQVSSAQDPELLDAYGLMLLSAGKFEGAQKTFETVLGRMPNDAVALYGVGLVQLAHNNIKGALEDFTRSAAAGGDREALQTAQLYAQWPGNAKALAIRPSPAIPNASMGALEAMSAYRLGQAERAESTLKTVLNLLPARGLQSPSAPLMTFDPAHPIRGGAMLTGPIEAPKAEGEKGVAGVVVLRPGSMGNNVATVAYKLDGEPLAIVGVAPFHFSWDTRTVPNGPHRLEIYLYDARGNLVDRGERTLYVANGFATATGEAQAKLAQALWSAFTLQPDGSACAMALAAMAQQAGKSRLAYLWNMWAAATRPDATARRRLASWLKGVPALPPLWQIKTKQKVVALTFDDGPKPGVTEALLDVLKRLQVKATFFVIGQHVLQYPDLTRQIANAGMEIANHSFTHPNLKRLAAQQIAQQMVATQAAIEWATGETPLFLRPPGGDVNDAVESVARQWGLTLCMWTVDAYDAELVGSLDAAEHVAKEACPGAIILMHNGKMSTVQALPYLVRTLRRRGYRFVTVSELLQEGAPTYQKKPTHISE